MLRLWLPHCHLLCQLRHTDKLFLRHLYTTSLCLDRRRPRISAGSYDSSISTFQKKSKGQKKREAVRSVDWAAEFANFSDSQVRRAIRWGNLKEEVFEAVIIVKKIGRYGRHARTRQLKLIGSMLREVDPELMETIIKAIKDGNVEGVFNKSGDLKDEDVGGDADDDFDNDVENEEDYNVDESDVDEDEEDEEKSSSSEDELDSMEHDNVVVERWLQGLLSGDSDVIAEVYSIRSADFNRQTIFECSFLLQCELRALTVSNFKEKLWAVVRGERESNGLKIEEREWVGLNRRREKVFARRSPRRVGYAYKKALIPNVRAIHRKLYIPKSFCRTLQWDSYPYRLLHSPKRSLFIHPSGFVPFV